jgi:hypothetical protein
MPSIPTISASLGFVSCKTGQNLLPETCRSDNASSVIRVIFVDRAALVAGYADCSSGISDVNLIMPADRRSKPRQSPFNRTGRGQSPESHSGY